MVFAADAPKPATGGEVTLLVNGAPVGRGAWSTPCRRASPAIRGMDIGCDNGLVVDRGYADKAPFRFTGEIKQVVFDIAPDMSEEDKQALHELAAQALAAHGATPSAGTPATTRGGSLMSDNDQLDVLIAVYLIPDLAQQDFDAFVKLAKEGTISTDGVALVTKDAEARWRCSRRATTWDARAPRSGRSGSRRSAPPPRGHSVGAAAGASSARSRASAHKGIGEKMDDALPPGSAIIAIYDHDDAPMRSPGRSGTPSARRSRRSTRPPRRSSRRASRRRRRGSRDETASSEPEHRGFVVVTGTSTGIGAATALHLADNGFHVLAGVRSEADGDALRAQVPGWLTPLIIEVTDQATISAAAAVADAVGERGLAGLVNNAGIAKPAPIEFQPMADFRTQLEVNLFGPVAMIQAFLPLIRRGGGRIVNVGSIGGMLVLPLNGAYSASKFGMRAISDAPGWSCASGTSTCR